MRNFTLNKLLILGMGNKLFGDDGVGIIVAEKLEVSLNKYENIDIEVTSWGGFRIIDLLSGYQSVIIIDALRTTQKPLGFIHRFDYKDLINSVRMVSFHDINFATAVEFAKLMDIPMPKKIKILGIEVGETDQFTEELSQDVKNSVNDCINIILEEINIMQLEKAEEFA